MPMPDDSGLPEEPYEERGIPNPYQPTQGAEPLVAPPRLAVDGASQSVNRAIGVAIGVLIVLGVGAMMANGVPLVAAVILMVPTYPAVGIFVFRTCRLTWWADFWINVAISVAVGFSVMVAAVVVCTAAFRFS